MYRRTIEEKLNALKKQFPVIAVFGPRQSGKTTLTRKVFSSYRYVNLESFEEQERANEDPKKFLERFMDDEGIILDEIQKAPKLLSYIQIVVDEDKRPGRFIITGSQNILLNQHVSQTLAGRVALLTLLPLSISELNESGFLPETPEKAIFQGFYPRIYDQSLDPVTFADSYVRTYIERDVREIQNITSLLEFQKFMRLCAARTGQLVDLSQLAKDASLSLPTVKAWLSVLEASYIIFFLQPHFNNYNKRIIKTPKLYFYDTALVCNLLRLTTYDDVYDHYLRGSFFETMIISNFMKERYHNCLPPNAYFWRDKSGTEIDCLLEQGATLSPIEIKSGSTLQSNMFDSLIKWCEIANVSPEKATLIYGGNEKQSRKHGEVIPWNQL